MNLLSPQQEMSEEESSTFLRQLKCSDNIGSFEAAYQTVKYLRKVLVDLDWKTAGEALDAVRSNGRKLIHEHLEYSIGNMVRRVLKIIKEEYHSSGKDKTDERDTQESLQKLLLADEGEEKYKEFKPDLRGMILGSIEELLGELEQSSEHICSNSLEYIQTKEVIMTYGNSRLVESFFKSAAKKRRFQVVVVESAPDCKGHDLAKSLANSSIPTTVVTDAAIFAMMARCNKVIIGTRSVMADGGLKASCGTHSLALAAKHYSVPVIVLAPMYKLSPQYLSSYDQDNFNYTTSPHKVMPYSSGEIISHVNISSPLYDYVPPQLIALYATNIGGTGGYAPPYIYRLLADLYHPDDYDLEDRDITNKSS